MMHPIVLVAAFGFLALAGSSDLRYRKISNRLNLAGLLGGLWLQFVLGGVSGLLAGCEGAAAGLFVLLGFFLAGLIGGGDVKFAAAVGAFVGWRVLLIGLAAGALLGGLVGALSLIRHRRFTVAMKGLFADLMSLASGVRPAALKQPGAVGSVPYGVLLAVGLAAALTVEWLRSSSWANLPF